MTEFEFLEKMFHRLSEAQHFQARDEKAMTMKKGETSPYELAALMIKGSIHDYLEMRNEDRRMAP